MNEQARSKVFDILWDARQKLGIPTANTLIRMSQRADWPDVDVFGRRMTDEQVSALRDEVLPRLRQIDAGITLVVRNRTRGAIRDELLAGAMRGGAA